jgi:hypothetical protein
MPPLTKQEHALVSKLKQLKALQVGPHAPHTPSLPLLHNPTAPLPLIHQRSQGWDSALVEALGCQKPSPPALLANY